MKRMSLPISKQSPGLARGRAFGVLLGCFMLTACGDSGSGLVDSGMTEDEAREIPCALDGESGFDTTCTRTLVPGEEGNQLILEGPDGSFRRFTILTDGRGLEATDGAQEPVIRILDNASIEVAIGGDRYRLPAKLRGTVGADLPGAQ